MERLTTKAPSGLMHLADSKEDTLNTAIKKLSDLEDLEEQGLLLKPKCKPGDIVWEANRKRNIVSEYEVASIRYGINKSIHYMWTLRSGIYSNLNGFWEEDFGRTVFLTQEEAEKALQERKENSK